MIDLVFQEGSNLFLAFCRIGGCLMLMPGFSSARIPMRVRLFVAMAASAALDAPERCPWIGSKPQPEIVSAAEAAIITAFLGGKTWHLPGHVKRSARRESDKIRRQENVPQSSRSCVAGAWFLLGCSRQTGAGEQQAKTKSGK